MESSIVCIFVTFIALYYTLPIVQLAYGNHYKDSVEATCNSTIAVSIPTWLIVEGSVGIGFVTSLIIFMLSAFSESAAMFLMLVPIILIGLFQFAWLIVGSVLFWRDCYHVMPDSLNQLMWASLIIGYISILVSSRVNTDKN